MPPLFLKALNLEEVYDDSPVSNPQCCLGTVQGLLTLMPSCCVVLWVPCSVQSQMCNPVHCPNRCLLHWVHHRLTLLLHVNKCHTLRYPDCFVPYHIILYWQHRERPTDYTPFQLLSFTLKHTALRVYYHSVI